MATTTLVATTAEATAAAAAAAATAAQTTVFNIVTSTAAAALAETTTAAAAPSGGGCGLLTDASGSHAFALEVQAMLAITCVTVLLVKKVREGNERSWFEFGLDGSKQLAGAGFIHAANMIISMFLGGEGAGDPCEWYWINIMIDTTFGVLVEYCLLKASSDVLWVLWGDNYDEDDYKTGEYWEKDNQGQLKQPLQVHWPKYFKQMAVWLCVVFCMKCFVTVIITTFPWFFRTIAHVALAAFELDSHLELIVVMVITPMCMNAVQFYLVDNIIKKSDGAGGAVHAREMTYAPLMEA